MKDTIILCHSQHLIISSKTRIMDKALDHEYILGICRLGISLYFPSTCQLSVSRYIRQQSAKYWLMCWSTSVISQPSHVSWYSVDMQLILHRHLADTLQTLGQHHCHLVGSYYWVLSPILRCAIWWFSYN